MSTDPYFLRMAETCGAVLTGKPDGSEPVTVVFTIAAWRAFDEALRIDARRLLHKLRGDSLP